MPAKKSRATDIAAQERTARGIAELVRIGYAPKSALKQRSIVFRVSLNEFERFTAAADADGRTLSNWLRKIANNALKPR